MNGLLLSKSRTAKRQDGGHETYKATACYTSGSSSSSGRLQRAILWQETLITFLCYRNAATCTAANGVVPFLCQGEGREKDAIMFLLTTFLQVCSPPSPPPLPEGRGG
eukprot:1161934-Pelagomonas_calceolata.AAC.5